MPGRIKRIKGITPKIDRWFDEVASAVESILNMTVTPPLQLKWSAGVPSVWMPVGNTRRFRLTANGGGGSYTGKELFEDVTGTWTDVPLGLTPTLREFNDNSSLTVGATTGLVVEATYYPPADEWRFQMGDCS